MYTKDRQGSSSKVPIILWIKYMPNHELAELEVAFKAMGKLIPEVGLMVAFHCDSYVSKAIKCVNIKALNKYFFVLSCHKGSTLTEDIKNMSSWCGWHTDHGSLTGLTFAMYVRDAVEMQCPAFNFDGVL